jgi:hypothetical protein
MRRGFLTTSPAEKGKSSTATARSPCVACDRPTSGRCILCKVPLCNLPRPEGDCICQASLCCRVSPQLAVSSGQASSSGMVLCGDAAIPVASTSNTAHAPAQSAHEAKAALEAWAQHGDRQDWAEEDTAWISPLLLEVAHRSDDWQGQVFTPVIQRWSAFCAGKLRAPPQALLPDRRARWTFDAGRAAFTLHIWAACATRNRMEQSPLCLFPACLWCGLPTRNWCDTCKDAICTLCEEDLVECRNCRPFAVEELDIYG